MATYKPLRIGDATRGETTPIRTFAEGDTIDPAFLPGGGGAASIVEITYADMATALAGATLTPGQYYNITDAAGTDLGFVCLAVQADEITVSGTGGYLNADFQAVGDYSGIEGITGQAAGTQQGIWQAANEGGYTQGDIVIWNLLHWQLADSGAIDGTDPATNTAAYTLLAKTAANVGYITAWDVSEFDFHNSWLQYRADLLGNLIRYSKGIDDQNFGYGFSIIPFFQWGNQTWYGNISNDGAIYQPNSAGFQAAGNVLYPGAFVADNVADKTHYFQVNTMFPFSEYRYNNLLATDNYTAYRQNTQQAYSSFNSNTIGDRTEVVNNTLFPNASVSSVSISDNPSVNNAIANNILENGAQLTGITAGANCQISRNKVGQGATLGGSTTMGDGAEISNNNIIGGIRRNNLSAETSISGNNNGGNINDNTILSGGISSNNIETDGSISENTVTQGSIELCKLFSGSSISGNTFENDGFLGITIYPNKSFSNNTVDGVGVFECIISNNIDGKTFAIEQAGKVSQSGISTFAETIGITGLTTLDCLAENNYVGIFTTASSNATETINQIDNAPTVFPIQIRPAAGLVLTVTGTAYAGIAAGQIALTTTDVTLDGDKGEYLELEIDPLGTGALIERNRVAGIL